MPEDVQWKHIIGAGFLGGIGFTMSIFITLLAFGDPEIVQGSKVGSILLSSFFAGTCRVPYFEQSTVNLFHSVIEQHSEMKKGGHKGRFYPGRTGIWPVENQ